ncbi:NAD-dependent epimerase/dehydratase family protein [Candidatus Microgenomates bacterium]|nr:MAG: NAD-dependent epimerase/dehydratase family protein [Candidatus Microgenomates bacterium]
MNMLVKNKNVLVTGGTGFIGSHLIEDLVKQGANIYVPFVEILPKSYFLQKKLDKKVVLEKIDINDREKILKFINKNNIEYVFHLAAQTIVTKAYEDPLTTLYTNIVGTLNILEAVRKNKNIKGIIVASSDKAYGKTTSTYKEDSPLRGDHPYDVSKSSADLISQTYFKTYNVPVVISRFGNVYGEGDLHFDRIIPGLCEAIVNKKVLEIRSNGKYIRDYIYVKDVVKGYLTLLYNLDKIKGEAFNFSSSQTLSVLDLVKHAEETLKIKIPYKIINNAQNEIPYQHLNDSKIRKLGWKREYNMKKKLKEIVKWYKEIL